MIGSGAASTFVLLPLRVAGAPNARGFSRIGGGEPEPGGSGTNCCEGSVVVSCCTELASSPVDGDCEWEVRWRRRRRRRKRNKATTTAMRHTTAAMTPPMTATCEPPESEGPPDVDCCGPAVEETWLGNELQEERE